MDATISSVHNSNENDAVLAQLTELFCDCIPQAIIRKIAQEQSWQLSDCIENLINYSNKINSGKTNGDTDDIDVLIESEEIQQPGLSEPLSQPSIDMNANHSAIAKYTGAIPKTSSASAIATFAWPTQVPQQQQQPQYNTMGHKQPTSSFSSFLQNGAANQFAASQSPYDNNNRRRHAKPPEHPDFQAIVDDIRNGHRVMVMMRGAPGSGKSTLARRLLDETMNRDYENHIFSTDDFFYDKMQDKYIYNRDMLETAHNANQSKVTQRAVTGWSPIIVDNTNMKCWEMVPYIRDGVQNGYLIWIMEPNTQWAKAPGKLAMKNKHGVPKNRIEMMLNNFEPTTVQRFFADFKLNYTVPVPVQRNYPALINTSNMTNNAMIHDGGALEQYESRNQRKRRTQPPLPTQPMILNNVVENNESDTFQLAAEQLQIINNRWDAYDPEHSVRSWETAAVPAQPQQSSSLGPREQRTRPNNQLNGIFDLLRDRNNGTSTETVSATTNTQTTDEPVLLEKHEKDCPRENDSFRQIRQIYPNISVSYLWDLFEKCNGDGNWTMDILLKDEDSTNANRLRSEELRLQDNFTCFCSSGQSVNNTLYDAAKAIPATLLSDSAAPVRIASPSIPQAKTSRRERIETHTESEIRRQIEEQFAINDESDSTHVKKIRELRRGILPGEPTTSTVPSALGEATGGSGGDSDDAMTDDEELIEMDLGVELVCQLDSVFGAEAFQRDNLKNMKTTVFMPKTLGQQLHAIWMESLYNQIEEQRQKSIKEDEEFAKQLHLKEKHPKIVQDSKPNNLREIMDMEYAWQAYQAEVHDWKKTTPQDLASKMTRDKLFEIFPNVNRDTLVEVLVAHDNKFASTVEVLKDSLGPEMQKQITVESQRLLKEVKNESQTMIRVVDQADVARKAQRALEAKKLGPEEAKKAALRDFEENRNMAQHHHHLKAECYAKAKEAFQRHDGEIAFYYTNVANLHKNKIDMFNHKAANAMVEVHSYTQKNPDMLDLHYLHSDEAIQCLDIFLDKQIVQARAMPRNFKAIFVITGRGLHSANGFATIKHKVKHRLKERYLSWEEVNPGLLKLRVHGNSVFTKDIYN